MHMQKRTLCDNKPLAYVAQVNADSTHAEPPGRDRLLAEIRGAGLRATASRVAVLEVLHSEHRPMSHSEVVTALSAHTWDRSTLYRNLMDLSKVGLLRRSELGDRTWRFEVACDHGHADHAAHFLCHECGDITCLPDLIVTPRDGNALPFALSQDHIEVQITGRCDTCVNAA